MRIADKFTLSRAVAAPVFFLLYFIPVWTGRFIKESVFILLPLFIFAEFTDFLDGFFARKNHEVSDFGKLFDPFADVMLHLGLFCCFTVAGYMPSILFLLIIYREFSMNFMRMVAALHGTAIGARKSGKIKTVAYVLACLYTLAAEGMVRLGIAPSAAAVLGNQAVWLYVLCTVCAYVSIAEYMIHFYRLKKKS